MSKKCTLTLSEDLYKQLLAIAEQEGKTPEDVIKSRLNQVDDNIQPLPQLLEGFVGAIESQTPSSSSREAKSFQDGVIEKLAKQGIRLP